MLVLLWSPAAAAYKTHAKHMLYVQHMLYGVVADRAKAAKILPSRNANAQNANKRECSKREC